jgi:hypothetical protein
VNDGLANIQNGHLVSGKNTGQTGGQAWLIFSGYIDQYDFSHFGLPLDEILALQMKRRNIDTTDPILQPE